MLIATLAPRDVILLTRQPIERLHTPAAVLLADGYCYDQPGGGGETAIKGDKQGLGLTTRNKQRFAAQQLLLLLGTLAHNVVIWARRWLAPQCPTLAHYGILRLVRDVGQISGFLVFDAVGQVVAIVLNRAAPLAGGVAAALDVLLAPQGIAVTLGET